MLSQVKENHPKTIGQVSWVALTFNTTGTMENKPVYARKPHLSASLYGFSYSS